MLQLKRHELKEAVASQLQGRSGSGIVRIGLPVESLDPLVWLRGQTVRPHWFWQGRGQDDWVAGVGITHVVKDDQFQDLNQAMVAMNRVLAQSDEGVRYFGGMAFDQRGTEVDQWESFGKFYFFVPRVLLEGDREQVRLVLQVQSNEDVTPASLLSELQSLTTSLPSSIEIGLGSVQRNMQTPNRETWCQRVQGVLDSLGEHSSKLVLACCRELETTEDLEPHAILAALNHEGQDAYQFFLGLEQSIFMGRSPELLYRREGRDLLSEALAGTANQNGALRESVKENHEQDVVIRDVQEAMEHVCDVVQVQGGKELAAWGTLTHLKTSLQGRLKGDVDDAGILQALHPTAAVLGYPRPWAWEKLHKVESLQRGWYAGPIGWIGRDQAEFCVAIRSALCQAKTLAIYAGAGIVKGSNPEQEWDEIRNKMRPFTELFVK